MKTEMGDSRWEIGSGGEGRRSAHDGKIVRISMDCKCKCIVVTSISLTYYLSEGSKFERLRRNIRKDSCP